ncbi:MAG: Heme chaperone HemW [Chlamydiia bacterium]|nr:Heme chaperone HemW [Chlamydiia bacterium]
MTTGKPPLGLYFHIPFCKQKCHYCHFYVTRTQKEKQATYFEAIKREWEAKRPIIDAHTIRSVYFGGGTPTQVPPDQFARFFELGLEIPPGVEVTIEANPEDITLEKMRRYKALGINRVSIGVQSLDDSHLQELSRKHSAKKAIEAIEITAEAGFSNISIDLMYEIPNQTNLSWQATLNQLEKLPITHLSLYNLVIEPHTYFHKIREKLEPTLPDSQVSGELLASGVAALEKLGLHRYEISAFAKKGCESIHNTGYWLGIPFLGLGPSASSYYGGERFSNVANLDEYGKLEDPVDFRERLPYPANLQELFAIRIRLFTPFRLDAIGTFPPEFHHTLDQLIQKGLISCVDKEYVLTEKGRLFYDDVATELIAEPV